MPTRQDRSRGYPALPPIPNSDRATRPIGGNPVPSLMDAMEQSATPRPRSPMADLVPYKPPFRYDGV